MIGRELGRYRVESKIGAGGMGEVYLGQDSHLDRPVAIKILASGGELEANYRRRLEREATALSRLNHPNIATVFDFDHDGDLDYLVMEFVEGESLAERLAQGPLREKDIRRWGWQIAEALAEAHALGILHRDIKPQNIMITRQRQAKVLDFGLAKLILDEGELASAVTATAAGTVVGTTPYIAPECLRGEPADPRSDVFALGAVLYEMATGQRAFRAESAAQLVDKILNEEPPSAGALNRQLSPALVQCIEKCLDKDPERRYQSAREVAVDLHRAEDFESSGSHPVTTAQAADGSWKRFAIPTFGLVAAAVVALFWFGSSEPALSFEERDWILVADFENQTGDERYDGAIQTAFLTSLEQSVYANVYPRARVAGVLERMGREEVTEIDEELGREICVRAEIRGLVTASIGRVGQNFTLSARLVDPETGESVRSYVENASGEDEILATLESISEALRRDLGESLASIHRHSAPLYAVTTASLDALRLYAEAQEAWRSLNGPLAVDLFQQALDLDPEFAMAHAALGAAYYSYIYNDAVKGEYHYGRALELSDRVTDRERRILEAEVAAHRNHLEDAKRLYRAYLALYPDDLGMQSGFAKLLQGAREFQEGAEVYREVLRLEPNDAAANINYGVCQAGVGDYEGAITSYENAFAVEPSWRVWGNLNHEYASFFAHLGRLDEASAVVREAVEANPSFQLPRRSLGLLALLQGQLDEAREQLDEAIELSVGDDLRLSRARNHVFSALLAKWEDDDARALKDLRAAESLLSELGPLATWWASLGIAFARWGEIAAAREALVKVGAQMDGENEEHRASILRLRGEILLAEGDFEGALAAFDESLRALDRIETVEAIALAHLSRRIEDEALMEALRRFVDVFPEPLGWEPQPTWQEAHVQLASLHLARDEAQLAAPLLDAVLVFWSEADPDFEPANRARALRAEVQ